MGLTTLRSDPHGHPHTRTDARVVPIIAMTADAFHDDVQKSKDAGMDGHIAKPIDPAVFYATLASQLNLPR